MHMALTINCLLHNEDIEFIYLKLIYVGNAIHSALESTISLRLVTAALYIIFALSRSIVCL